MARDAVGRRTRLALAAAIIGSGVGFLDSTIVNIALPTIQRSLGGGLAAQQWVVNAYLLTLGSLILVGGSLQDVFGARRVFSLGIGGFGACSVLCGLAPSIGALVAFRALQGIAGAMLVPSSLALIVGVFPEPERGRAIGTWTAFTTVATVIAPLLGGALLAAGSWRLVFFVNVPFVLVCLALIRAGVPGTDGALPRRQIDVPGALACVIGLGGIVFALIEQPRLGWSSAGVIGPLAGGVGALVAFVALERRGRDPMLPFALFARANFTAANCETLVVYAGLGVLVFFLVLFLQQVADYAPIASGLALLPVTLLMFTGSRLVGSLSARLGARLFMSAGPLTAAAGLLLLLRVDARASYLSQVLPGVLVFGVGLTLTVAPLTATVLDCVPESQAGIASAVNNAVARIAGLVATAAAGSVLAAHFAGRLQQILPGRPSSGPERTAILAAERLTLGRPSLHGLGAGAAHALARAATLASVSTFHLAMLIAACLLASGAAVGAVAIDAPPARSARRGRVGKAVEQRVGMDEVHPDG
jgi:EmrB/QacA subfamily drug resistance transporter